MRVHAVRATALLLCGLFVLPAVSEPTKENFAATLAKSAGSSVASAGAMALAKALTGKFYDATCAKEVTKDWAEEYFCNAIAGFSGRDEQQWKQKIETQLADIKSSLDVLQEGQKRMQFELTQNHAEIYRLFKQAAAEEIATKSEADFETLWKEYVRQFDDDLQDVNRAAMVKLAKKILSKEFDDKLALYNTVLTSAFRGNQALLRYPFYDYKEKHQFRAPFFNGDNSFDTLYEGAERAFIDSRARQEKVYAMVLWAIKVLESDCQINTPCTPPAITAKEFKKAFDSHTRDQVLAFNEGLSWVLFTYGETRANPWFLQGRAEEFMTRANLLNATLLGNGEGAWGQVIAMGPWDGTITMQCGANSGTLKPRFHYSVPVATRFGDREIDWWSSRSANGVYDEVHFAKDWKVYHYSIPDAKLGACSVAPALPGKGTLPWVQPGTEVMRVKTAEGKDITFGSFLAIQRAGGTYAMASGGKWKKRNEPFESDTSTANIKNGRYDWMIDTNGRFPMASVLFEGRGEFNVVRGADVQKNAQIYLYDEKAIYFPDDREVKLAMLPGGDCAKVCRNSSPAELFVMDYDLQNGGNGELLAVTALFLRPDVADPGVLTPRLGDRAKGNGIYVEGSFGMTKERKTKTVDGVVSGTVKTKPNTAYHLQYLIDLHLFTTGAGFDATQFMYRTKITPAYLYFTK
jgi:hypothetical protein